VSGEANVPFITHDLRTVIAQLTTKIDQLAQAKAMVQEQLNAGKDPDLNRQALEEICESLEAAKNGKILLMNSCCNGQNCNIEYADS
jgi:DNA-binding Xre family transcriptional regulator